MSGKSNLDKLIADAQRRNEKNAMRSANMELGKKIKQARKERGLTQAQLAEACGVATITIRQYESDSRMPNLAMLSQIAQVLDVPVSKWLPAVVEKDQEGREVIEGRDAVFYGEYKKLDDRDKEAVQDFVRVMRERQMRGPGDDGR